MENVAGVVSNISQEYFSEQNQKLSNVKVNMMSKLMEMTSEIATNESTGKRRILTHIYRDEVLDLAFILDANMAEQWAAKLMFLAKECRNENPTKQRFTLKLKQQILMSWKNLLRIRK